jgi:hypothetical protein
MAIRATRCIANDNDPSAQHTETDDSRFTVVLSPVLDLKSRPGENQFGVLEGETAFSQGGRALPRIEGDCHRLVYLQKQALATGQNK